MPRDPRVNRANVRYYRLRTGHEKHDWVKGVTNKAKLAWEIKDLIGFSPRRTYPIVGHIIQVMKEALLRGEEVRIEGFGVFKSRTFWAHGFGRGYWKTNIMFKPSKAFTKLVNENPIEDIEESENV